jgi:2-dehydropantoate 2-reductase
VENQPILIVGTGALATLFAARLTAAGHGVTVLGTWPEGLRALREDGARLVDSNGHEQTFRVTVADDPQACRGTRHAIVLVKAWQTEHAARQLKECLAGDGLAVTLQNGLGNREILAKYLDDPFTAEHAESAEKKQNKNRAAKPASRVALGTTTTGATLLGPGRVKAGGEGVISLEAHPALGPMEEALKSARFKVDVVQDALALVWGKLVINAAINPLTALLRVPNGELLERPAARALMRTLAQEAAAVASAERVNLAFSDAAAAVEEVAKKTALNHSSMLQDIERGAPTEIDAICGAVTRAGEKHGVPTPVNRACWQLVKALVEGGPRLE